MAKAIIKREVSINLTLTEDETRFLAGYLQNWLGRPGDESKEHTEKRTELHRALHNALADISQNFR